MYNKENEPPKGLTRGQAAREKKMSEDGYPSYPVSEDIYSKFYEERDLNPEEPTHDKESNEGDMSISENEKAFIDALSSRSLDIPGSELDDEQEDIGSEDEENNFYSLGGDGHSGLDENNNE